MAADRPGRGAGRVKQHGVEGRGVEGEHIGHPDLGGEFQPREIDAEPLQPLRRAVDGHHVRAGGGEFGGLAAGRGAQIGDPLAGAHAEQTGRERRRRVLHPPFAVGVALELGYRLMRAQAHRAGRQHDAAQPGGPARRIAFNREIERRLAPVRRRDRRRLLRAVVGAPARREPGRRVVVQRIALREYLVARARDIAQHGIGEAGERRRQRVGARRAHRQIDRRVIGHIEKKNLRRAGDENPFQHGGFARHAALEELVHGLAQGAEAAHRHGDDGAREGAVARLEARQLLVRLVAGEALVDGMTGVDDVGEHMRRRHARREAGMGQPLLERRLGLRAGPSAALRGARGLAGRSGARRARHGQTAPPAAEPRRYDSAGLIASTARLAN